jgi:hypothetical protein
MFTRITEKLKGWKTILANALTGLPAALYGVYLQFQGVDVTPLIPAKYAALAVVGMSVLGIVLRIVTTGPVGSKGEEVATPDIKAGD